MAAETWHQEKDGLAKEMKQFEKAKMSQVLKEIELDDMNKPDQQLYGTEAYENWSRTNGKKSTKDNKEEEPKAKTGQGLYKANSFLKTVTTDNCEKSPESSKPQLQKSERHKQTISSRQTTDSNCGLFEDALPKSFIEEVKSVSRPPSAKCFYNPESWNTSSHLPLPTYTTNLTDYYPRDEYTMMPIYPLKKGPDGKPIPAIPKQIQHKRSELPPDFVERALSSTSPHEKKNVLFKCQNIIDAQRRKHFIDDDGIAKSETALHLSDPTSILYRSALVHTRPFSFTVDHGGKKFHSSRTSSNHVNYDMKGVLQIMSNISKPTIFPNIKGHQYELYAGEVP